jgi:hypothetical protein
MSQPLFEGPYYTVNKMRTATQPQLIKANKWEVSSKDFVCYKAGGVLTTGARSSSAGAGGLHPTLAKIATQPSFSDGKCFQFERALVGPIGAQNYRHASSLMPNSFNPSDHACVIGIVELGITRKRN